MLTAINKLKARALPIALATLLVVSNSLFGLPLDMVIEAWNKSKIVDNLYTAYSKSEKPVLPTFVGRAQAANFSMQTGYYVGNGGTQSISGLGFQPQFVIIKSDTSAGSGIWKTSAHAANTSAFFSATANNTGSLITLSANGFSVANNANVNSANVRYTWTAFAGSDCTATGTFCVGSYTGNGAASRKITTGFQPAFAMVKRSTNASAASFRTASMANNVGNYFTNTAQNTAGGLFTTINTDGFNVGAAVNNVNSGSYHFVAFKAVSGVMAVGTYSGNGTDNRNITGFGTGAVPDFVFVKNANSGTANNRIPYMSNTHSFGDQSGRIDGATAVAANIIQKLQGDGFQVGSGVQSNQSGSTIYWVAMGGSPPYPSGSGEFEMATGTYAGTGSTQSITGLDFTPDLVVLKDTGANYAVFRSSLMAANNTAYLSNAVTNFTGGITSLNSDGFTVGTSTVTNNAGATYHWQAFGNAYNPVTRSGSTDFMIGAYTGNGIDNRDVTKLPFQPDFVAIKRSGATAGTWRSTANSGDSSSFFGATADGANRVQALNSDGFQLGTNANVNTSGNLYHWFAFKTGTNFTVGTYAGNSSSQSIVSGFQPDLLWTKRSTSSINGVYRASTQTGDSSQYFANLANVSGRITGFLPNGFTVGNQTETNANGVTYRYASWRIPNSGSLAIDIVDDSDAPVASPSVAFSPLNVSLSCQSSTGILGTSTQKLRVVNTTINGNWNLAIAATGGTTANWSNGSNTYDFNDPNGAPGGCNDGGDTDSLAGQLAIDPSVGTVTALNGCNTTGITKGSSSAFNQGVINSITLLNATSSQVSCHFDLTGVTLAQQVPAEVPSGTPYSLNMTITVTAN